MKKCKKIMSILLVIVLLITSTPSSIWADKGFSYDDTIYNVVWKAKENIQVYSELNGKVGTCSYFVGLARRKGTNTYVLMTREAMTPNTAKVKIYKGGNMGLTTMYGYGFSEFISAKSTLPDLDDYAPKNEPSTTEIEFSLGADSDTASVGASYTYTVNELDISAHCDTGKNLFFIKYDYKPHLINPLASNEYMKLESIQLGAAEFTSKKRIFHL